MYFISNSIFPKSAIKKPEQEQLLLISNYYTRAAIIPASSLLNFGQTPNTSESYRNIE